MNAITSVGCVSSIAGLRLGPAGGGDRAAARRSWRSSTAAIAALGQVDRLGHLTYVPFCPVVLLAARSSVVIAVSLAFSAAARRL